MFYFFFSIYKCKIKIRFTSVPVHSTTTKKELKGQLEFVKLRETDDNLKDPLIIFQSEALTIRANHQEKSD